MIELATEQKTSWLEGLAEFDDGNRAAILAVFAAFGIPEGYLDVGCGTGAMVKLAHTLGVDAHGVDQLPNHVPYIYERDLRRPFDMARRFDIVTSIEFVEHVEPEYADIVCESLARHVNKYGRLILTAAAPGQPGYNHFNCQPKEYWREKINEHGLQYHQTDTAKLIQMWSVTHMKTHWLESNLQVFMRV